ncbi:MAG: hypothetical protein PW788_10935 [Micavibrio sp.]|nr:hypothetical protein [Micavibrio sp.]
MSHPLNSLEPHKYAQSLDKRNFFLVFAGPDSIIDFARAAVPQSASFQTLRRYAQACRSVVVFPLNSIG